MKLYPFPHTKINGCLFGAFLLALLMLTRDSIWAMASLGFVKAQILTLLLLLAAAGVFLFVQRKHLGEIFRDPRLAAAGVLTVLFLLPMLIKRDWQLMYLSIIFYILIAVFISYFMNIKELSRYYLTILTVLGLYSVLCTYFLRQLPDRGILNIPVFERAGDSLPFYQFGFCAVSLKIVASRNFGIFREPGAYQFFLLLGLFLNNCVADWEKSYKTWTINAILGAAMISTFATGGIIEMVLLAIFLFWDEKWYRSRKAWAITGVIVLVLAAGAGYVILTENALYADMTGTFTKFAIEGNDSGTSRVDSILTDLMIFLHHPILGADLNEVMHAVQDNTTSTMIQYAAFGFLAASIHVVSWVALSWDKKRKLAGNLILPVILFMSFNTQNLIGNPFFWLFPIAALMEKGMPAVIAFGRRKGEKRLGT